MCNNNDYWDKIAEEYASEIISIQPRFYQNAAKLINNELFKDALVADVGNGGVINYQTCGLKQLDCIDLSLSQTAIARYKDQKNIRFLQGDILDLPLKSNTYDVIIVQAVLHHLAEKSLQQTRKNVAIAIKECLRVLKPEGKLLVVESTVVPWFEMLERLFYIPMQWFFRMVSFDAVYQFSNRSLLALLKAEGVSVKISHSIELDRYIWLMKRKIPTCVTPCRAVWMLITKNSES